MYITLQFNLSPNDRSVYSTCPGYVIEGVVANQKFLSNYKKFETL